MILVLGATGSTGGEVARQLIAAGITPRLLVRSRTKAAAFDGKADIVEGEIENPVALSRALAGVEKLYLVSAGAEGPRLETTVIDAAKQSGVQHVVKLSVITAEDPKLSYARWHHKSEQHLLSSGLPWTMLRPGNFHVNALSWAPTIKAHGAFYLPTGTGRWSSIDPADIAAVAVKALTTPGHEGKAYVLTGSESLSGADYAAKLSTVLQRSVTFVDVPEAAARDGMAKAGMPAAELDALMDLLAVMKANRADFVSHEVEQLLGRKPVLFEAWVQKNAAAFLPDSH